MGLRSALSIFKKQKVVKKLWDFILPQSKWQRWTKQPISNATEGSGKIEPSLLGSFQNGAITMKIIADNSWHAENKSTTWHSCTTGFYIQVQMIPHATLHILVKPYLLMLYSQWQRNENKLKVFQPKIE